MKLTPCEIGYYLNMKAEKAKMTRRLALDIEFLELLKSYNLTRINRVDVNMNNTPAGVHTDLISPNLQFLDDDQMLTLVTFMKNKPDEAKALLIKGGGFKQNEE